MAIYRGGKRLQLGVCCDCGSRGPFASKEAAFRVICVDCIIAYEIEHGRSVGGIRIKKGCKPTDGQMVMMRRAVVAAANGEERAR